MWKVKQMSNVNNMRIIQVITMRDEENVKIEDR